MIEHTQIRPVIYLLCISFTVSNLRWGSIFYISILLVEWELTWDAEKVERTKSLNGTKKWNSQEERGTRTHEKSEKNVQIHQYKSRKRWNNVRDKRFKGLKLRRRRKYEKDQRTEEIKAATVRMCWKHESMYKRKKPKETKYETKEREDHKNGRTKTFN